MVRRGKSGSKADDKEISEGAKHAPKERKRENIRLAPSRGIIKVVNLFASRPSRPIFICLACEGEARRIYIGPQGKDHRFTNNIAHHLPSPHLFSIETILFLYTVFS